jgi:hypothetical protein
MRKPFIPITAIAVMAILSGCASNTTPTSNPRPGWTKAGWNRALVGRLARVNAEQHPLISPLESVPSAGPRTDAQLRQAFMGGIAKELERGKYDELEAQFTRFHKTGEELKDGSRKIWLYFAAFQNRTAFAPSLDDAKTFVQTAEDWTKAMPTSVVADLALCNALLGEMSKIAELGRKGALGGHDPKLTREFTDLFEECKGQITSPPQELRPALETEPEFYDVALKLLGWTDAGFAPIGATFEAASTVDPFYLPIYLQVSIWLNRQQTRQEGAPKPGAWLTKILKPDRADPEPVRQEKLIIYAQTVALLPTHPQLDPQDLDWPTLKVGLFQLARTHKGSLDWPSRYLALAYAFQDAEAAKEALELIQGNYSPDVFKDPVAFRDISRWAEEASKEKSKPKPKANP